MTRVSIAPPDTEEDVSAEQVAAYLLARWWTECTSPEDEQNMVRAFEDYAHSRGWIEVPMQGHGAIESMWSQCLEMLAAVEQRHPSAVLADIVGPARAASVGAECYSGSASFEEAKARFECKARMGLVKWMKPPADRAARGAGESEAD